MTCPFCGNELAPGAGFCAACGNAVNVEAAPQAAPQAPYAAPQAPYGAPQAPYGAPQAPYGAPYGAPAAPAAVPGKGLGIASMVLGILALVLGCFYWLIGIILAIIGAALGGVALSKAKKVNGKNGMAVAGLVCSIVSLGINVIFLILGGAILASLF